MSQTDRSQQLIVDQEFLKDFVDESRDHLETISQGLLQLEGGSEDPDQIDSVFRALHTIKGLSAFLGLGQINKLSHAGENVLDAIRVDKVKPTRDVIDPLLKTCDLLSALIDDAINPAQEAGRDEHLESLLEKLGEILDLDCAGASADPGEPRPAGQPVLWPRAGTSLPSDLVRQFVAENADNLHEIEAGLLKLEKQPGNVANLNAVFRAIHSVKGTADYVGLAQIKTLSHHLESVLDLARASRLEITPQVTSLVLEGVDALRSMINDLRPDGEADRDLTDLAARLLGTTAAASATGQQPASPQSAAMPSKAESPLGVFLQSACQHVESIQVQSGKLLAGDTSETTLTTLRRSLKTLVNAADYMERGEFLAPCDQFLSAIEPLLQSSDPLDEKTSREIADLAQQLGALLDQLRAEVQHDRGATESASPAAEKAAAEPTATACGTQAGKSAARSMRVDQEKLDDYVNLAGELVIARNTLTHAFRQFQSSPREGIRRLKGAIDGVDRITATLQDNAMAMRMVPVKTIFQRFSRVVRDIAKAQGKKIELQVFGEETEIDKQVAEALGDPLVHLIRNSADHGIELPEVRRAAGKSETGLITLKAGREGNSVVIDIIDDGAGIHVDRLKAKALENGVITRQQAESMPREEAINLIFAAGLSTAKQVTDISGRGVGMDVVRTNVRNVGGNVFVSSREGEGTQLRIQLPLTLAVTTALLVGCKGHTYALPIEVVRETLKVPPSRLKTLNGYQAITLRGQIIPVMNLADMLLTHREFNGKQLRLDRAGGLAVDDTGRVPLVVVHVGGEQYGLAVDAVEGRQEIVLKPLPEYLARLPGLGSATVMGDGTIVLILDPSDLYQAALADSPARSI